MSRNYQQHPELFPWVPKHGIDEAACQRAIDKHEAEMAACTCDWDEGARYAEADFLCPVHAEEDRTDAAATAIDRAWDRDQDRLQQSEKVSLTPDSCGATLTEPPLEGQPIFILRRLHDIY